VIRTRKICMYPNVQVYNGSGSTDDEASFSCEEQNKDDKQLLEQDRIAKRFDTSTKAAD
jgi:hypothetical protein